METLKTLIPLKGRKTKSWMKMDLLLLKIKKKSKISFFPYQVLLKLNLIYLINHN